MKRIIRRNQVFFKNIPKTWDASKLWEFIKSWVECQLEESDVFVAKFKTGESRGNGIVDFKLRSICWKAINSLHNLKVED